MTEEDIVKEAKEAFEESAEAWNENRQAALEDLRFSRLAEQWPAEILRQRQKEGRPALTINRMPAFIRQVVNDGRQGKPAIKISPVDSGADPETADILSGIIRHIEYNSVAQAAYDTGLEYAVSCGFGFWRIDVDYAHDFTFEKELYINRIANPLSVYPDPETTAVDSSDWMTCLVTEVMCKEAFERRWPEAEASSFQGDDDQTWLTEDTIRVAEYWWREKIDKKILMLSNGAIIDEDQYLSNQELFDGSGLVVIRERPAVGYRVKQAMVSGAGLLEPVEDWAGKYIPIVPCYGEDVFVEGKRYFRSLVRDARDPQTMLNYWRTTSTELVALAPKAPWVGPAGAFDTDREKWETANTENHAYLQFDGSMAPERQAFAGVPAGALQEAANASEDMKEITGIYNSALGQQSNEISGKAIMFRQRESDVGTFHFHDNQARAINHTGRILLDLIPSVYSEPRTLRIIGLDGKDEMVAVNQKTLRNGMEQVYDLTSGRYDVVVDTGPSYTTKRQEAADQMMTVIQAFPDAARVAGDLLAKNLDWPGSDELARRLQMLLPDELKELDGMEQVPEEARPLIANLANQLKQANDTVKQQQEVIADLSAATKLKDREIQASILEERIKAQSAIEKQILTNTGKMDVERLQAAVDLILKKLEIEGPTNG